MGKTRGKPEKILTPEEIKKQEKRIKFLKNKDKIFKEWDISKIELIKLELEKCENDLDRLNLLLLIQNNKKERKLQNWKKNKNETVKLSEFDQNDNIATYLNLEIENLNYRVLLNRENQQFKQKKEFVELESLIKKNPSTAYTTYTLYKLEYFDFLKKKFKELNRDNETKLVDFVADSFGFTEEQAKTMRHYYRYLIGTSNNHKHKADTKPSIEKFDSLLSKYNIDFKQINAKSKKRKKK